MVDPFGAQSRLETAGGTVSIYRLGRLVDLGILEIARLPFALRVWLESLVRQCGNWQISETHVENLCRWQAKAPGAAELPFKPARVVLQDFTGVPAVVDLAALRSAMARLGDEPDRINPQVPVDLVIDHSLQIDKYGDPTALHYNAER